VAANNCKIGTVAVRSFEWNNAGIFSLVILVVMSFFM
jgi:hypothetical protein